MEKVLITSICFIVLSISGKAQNNLEDNYPEIGKPCPDFLLNSIKYSSRKQASLIDYKGKWLVLDFFTTGCTSCFMSFPKINKLRKDFEGTVNFLLIAWDDGKIGAAYEKYRQKQSLDLPVAFVEPSFFKRFGIVGVPHVIVIDQGGIVRAITSSLAKEDIQSFLSGNSPHLFQNINKRQEEERAKLYDAKKLLLTNGNGGNDTDFLYRSILTKWKGDIIGANPLFIIGPNYSPLIPDYLRNRIQVVGYTLSSLYLRAYGDTLAPWPDGRGSSYGKYWPTPILELSDSSEFQYSNHSNKNLYNYSSAVSKERSSARHLQMIMQDDLKHYFGYEVKVETRLMPCWNLVASDKAKKGLKSKKNAVAKEYPPMTGFSLVNRPVYELIDILFGCFQTEPPFLDQTMIKENIDLEIDALLTDLNDVKKSLQKNGLALIKGEKQMKVIVIRDRKY